MQFFTRGAATILILLVTNLASAESSKSRGDQLLDSYFAHETSKVTARCLSEVKTLGDWQARRDEYRNQLREMLGLSPWPKRMPLQPVVTGSHTRDEVIVENLHFQSLPHLYVTANLYRPEHQEGPLPAVLYVCGHGPMKIDGVSYGNKTTYQHHGAWFARNGYVCLTIDTIQMGEIEGLHHGTYREGMWWWHNRGYTPAGVEAWNGIRALDYLQSRPEVDGERLGMTGRSGGGIYTWWVAALDERVKAAVPVAGITSMKNHVVDGCIEGHCDCMFMVNTYGWDFPTLAALIAPRPLLISNTDKDGIFPLDGVVDVYFKTRRIYELYDAVGHIGLNICEGPHKDTQELRVNAFHWLNRFLKDDTELIEETATKRFAPEELKVFSELPADEIVTTIQETFVPQQETEWPQSQVELDQLELDVVQRLKETALRNLPADDSSKAANQARNSSWSSDSNVLEMIEFQSDTVYSLPIFVLHRQDLPLEDIESLRVTICDEAEWTRVSNQLASAFPDCSYVTQNENPAETTNANESSLIKDMETDAVAFLLPRGIGPTAWSGDARKQTHIKRRFALLGQTLDAVRIHDVIRGVESLKTRIGEESHFVLEGDRAAADWAMFAALMGPEVSELQLMEFHCDFRDGPQLLQVSQFVTKPMALLLAANRVSSLKLSSTRDQDYLCANELEQVTTTLGWDSGRISIIPAGTP